jgi:solute carrier family 25 ornithine transporter 2/15
MKDGLWRGLYAGTMPSLAANVAENSILFAANGVCQPFVASILGVAKVEDLSPLANGFSGFLAAFWSSLALCPTELVKCRLQAMRESHAEKGLEPPRIGPLSLTKQIIRSEGFRGLFHGLTPTFTREMPGYFCFFFAYEMSRELLTPEGKFFTKWILVKST